MRKVTAADLIRFLRVFIGRAGGQNHQAFRSPPCIGFDLEARRPSRTLGASDCTGLARVEDADPYVRSRLSEPALQRLERDLGAAQSQRAVLRVPGVIEQQCSPL